MERSYKKYILIISILSILSIGSYIFFVSYQPKVFKVAEAVKGANTGDTFSFPYPENSEKIGFNQNSNLQQTTFQTTKNPQEVVTFYKGVFQDKGWELDAEIENTNEFITKFKKGNQRATVISTTTDGSNFTIVSVELAFL